jgi:hypothetical protein
VALLLTRTLVAIRHSFQFQRIGKKRTAGIRLIVHSILNPNHPGSEPQGNLSSFFSAGSDSPRDTPEILPSRRKTPKCHHY